MVRQADYRFVSYCLLTLLFTHGNANAQTSNGPAVFIPFGSPSLWEAGSGSRTAALPGYATSPAPTLVARQRTQPYVASPETNYAFAPNLYSQPQSGCDDLGHVAGQQAGYPCPEYRCEAAPYCQPRPAASWYASAAGLYLSRDGSVSGL